MSNDLLARISLCKVYILKLTNNNFNVLLELVSQFKLASLINELFSFIKINNQDNDVTLNLICFNLNYLMNIIEDL